MNSNFLTNLGIAGWDMGIVLFILVIILFILAVISIILLVELCKLKKRYNRFSAGRDAKSLEKEIGSMFVENVALRDMTDKNRKDIRHIYRKLETSYQKIGLIKYDAFPQMGGKLSFSLCMLNEKDDGFILNSVHGSDGCYTYLKEIESGRCNLTLGAEEEKALRTAMHEIEKQ